ELWEVRDEGGVDAARQPDDKSFGAGPRRAFAHPPGEPFSLTHGGYFNPRTREPVSQPVYNRPWRVFHEACQHHFSLRGAPFCDRARANIPAAQSAVRSRRLADRP